jgi:hypothetical protein
MNNTSLKPKLITIEEYTKRMNKVITKTKNMTMDNALIMMLDEACKYQIVDSNKKVVRKGSQKSKIVSKSGTIVSQSRTRVK